MPVITSAKSLNAGKAPQPLRREEAERPFRQTKQTKGSFVLLKIAAITSIGNIQACSSKVRRLPKTRLKVHSSLNYNRLVHRKMASYLAIDES